MQPIVSRPVLERIYREFWQVEQDKRRYHTLVRKFWENPDNNESYHLAFKKHDAQQKKPNLRDKLPQLKDKQSKCWKLYYHTVDFVFDNLIPMTWDRECIKLSKERVEDAKFDKMYAEMMQK